MSQSVINNEFSHTILHKENVFDAAKKAKLAAAAEEMNDNKTPGGDKAGPTSAAAGVNAQGHYNKIDPKYAVGGAGAAAGGGGSYMPQPQRAYNY